MALYLSLSLWRDISIVWLSLLCFIGLVIPLALAYLAVRGMNAALNKTGIGIVKAQQYSRIARDQTTRLSARVREPVIQANRGAAKWWQVSRLLFPAKLKTPPVSSTGTSNDTSNDTSTDRAYHFRHTTGKGKV